LVRQIAKGISVAPKKIAFLVSHSSPGGVQELWANLAEGFAARGYRTDLLALYPAGDEPTDPAARLPWRYIRSSRPRGLLGLLQFLWFFIRFFRNERPDVVITAMPAANVLAPLAARLAASSAAIIITHHSPVETQSRLLNMVDAATGSLGTVRYVVSVSEAVSRSLDSKPAAYRSKRRTIHNALPPKVEATLLELAAHRRRLPTSRQAVALGRLAEQKNYPLLLRAAAHMPDVTINIIGEGPDRELLQALASELGVEARVNFLGHQPRRAALERLAGGDVFVQVSLFEGHSLALIEAAKLGLPLVVSNVPVQVEGITASDGSACGLVVSLDDHEGVARAILSLLDDAEAYEAWTLRSLQLARESSFDAMVGAYQRLLG
jgi:glycosyltransferase involved in cell wall biosynthesis